MGYAPASEMVFNNWADGVAPMSGIEPHEMGQASQAHAELHSPVINNVSSLSASMALFDQPLPAQPPLVDNARIEASLASDQEHYAQTADAFKTYWSVSPPSATKAFTDFAPRLEQPAVTTSALDAVADIGGGIADSLASPVSNTVNTSRLTGYLNALAQPKADSAPDPVNTFYANRRKPGGNELT
jgi:hypothetical protein